MVRFNADIESTELKIKTISGSRDEMAQKREEYADKLQQLRLDILGLRRTSIPARQRSRAPRAPAPTSSSVSKS